MDALEFARKVAWKVPRVKPYGVEVDTQSITFIQDEEREWKFDYDEELNMRLFIGNFDEFKDVLAERIKEIFEETGETVKAVVRAYAYDEEKEEDVPVELEKDEDGSWYAKLPDGEEVYVGDIEDERSLADEFVMNNYNDLFDSTYMEHMTGIRAAEYLFAVPNPSIGLESTIRDTVRKFALSSLIAANDEAIGKAARQTGGSCSEEETERGEKILSCHIYTEDERYPYVIVYVR